jgi:hypothetical protein
MFVCAQSAMYRFPTRLEPLLCAVCHGPNTTYGGNTRLITNYEPEMERFEPLHGFRPDRFEVGRYS